MKAINMFNFGIAGFLLCLLSFISASAQNSAEQELKIVTDVDTLRLPVNGSARINAKVVDKNGKEYPRTVDFFSGFPGLGSGSSGTSTKRISVDGKGNIHAFKPGSYTILAMVGESYGRVSSKVIRVEVAPLPASKIELKGNPDRYYQHTTTKLDATVFDKEDQIKAEAAIIFSSSDSDIAAITPGGFLKAKKKGRFDIIATSEGVQAKMRAGVIANPVTSIDLSVDQSKVRTGDVVHITASTRDKNGNEIDDVPVVYAFFGYPFSLSGSNGSGLINQDGHFVANKPGTYTIIAKSGFVSGEVQIQVTPRNVQQTLEVAGHVSLDVPASDLWVWEGVDGRDYAVTGTWNANGEAYFWDITDPEELSIIDTVRVDARTVNDVKVSQDGRTAVISREGASNRRNGIVILDVSNPSRVEVISTFDDGLTGGVHNVFIYNNHVFAVNNTQKYDIINIEDPKKPYRVSTFELERPGHVVHDVWVENGIAYSSNFGDGLAVVDVGSKQGEWKTAGGSPENPIQLASHTFENGWTHAAFPFKSKSTGDFYVAVGDEVFPGGKPAGWIHFVKFDGWGSSEEVAWYEVPEAGSHNMWIEDDTLYVGYYNGGLRVVDISGELIGNLYDQGREIARFIPEPEGKRVGFVSKNAMTWGAQPYKDHIFIVDMNSGFWALKLSKN